jgi:hypothetical protein
MTHQNGRSRTHEVADAEMDGSRREALSSLLGLAAGGAALTALTACIADEGSLTFTDTVSEALDGTSGIKWVSSVESLRNLVGAANNIAILQGYTTEGDGGGGLFVWSPTSSVDDGGTFFNILELGQSAAGWRRIYEGPRNVRWYGALGSSTDDGAAIQRAIDSLGVTGGTVFFPSGTYLITTTLTIGGETYQQGVRLLGSGASTAAVLYWCGVENDGPILKIRNSSYGALEAIHFLGAGMVSTGLQFTHTPGNGQSLVTEWAVRSCYFRDAKVYSVLVGEPDESSNDGDCATITFDNCMFQGSSYGVHTTSHVRLRSEGTLGTAFLNCRFTSSYTASPQARGYPSRAISMQTGTATVHGGLFELQPEEAIYLDSAPNREHPSICVYGSESQGYPGGYFLRTSIAGSPTAPKEALRATVLSGVMADNILAPPYAATTISWGIGGKGALVLEGVHVQGNIDVTNASANVFSSGAMFWSGTFTGYSSRVSGTWSEAGIFKSQLPHGDMTLTLNPLGTTTIRDGWIYVYSSGYVLQWGAPSGNFYQTLPLRVGDRIKSITYAHKVVSTGYDMTVRVLRVSSAGVVTSLGSHQPTNSSSWSDNTLDVADTLVANGDSIFVEYEASSHLAGHAIGTLCATYDRPAG